MSDASIPLSFHAPAADIYTPLDAQAKRLSLQQMMQSTQMNAQRIQEEQMKAKNLADDQQDEQTIQRAFVDNGGDHDKIRQAIGGKVHLRNLQRWDADHLAQQHAASALTTEQRQAYQANADAMAQEAAKLLQTPADQRAAATQQSLESLKKFGIDTSGFQFDPATGPSDQQLQAILAGSKYSGQVATLAEKKAQEEQRRAAAARATKQAEIADQEESEKQKQRMRETAARTHLSVTTPEQHAEWLKSLPPEIAGEYAGAKAYNPQTRKVIQGMALSSKDRMVDEDRDKAQQAREEAQLDRDRQAREGLDIRQQLANQSGAFQSAMLALKGSGAAGRRTPAELGREERNIDALETGTATRPGLNLIRTRLGQQLKSGKNDKGKEFRDKDGTITDQAEHDRIQTELQAVNDNLQHTQFRKAKLYGIANPEPADIAVAEDGAEIEALDGSVWKKQNGVAFFSRMAGQQAAAKPAAAPAATPTPASTPKPTAPAAKPAAASAQPNVGQRFSNGKTTVKWDGQNYIDESTGKPAVFK